MHSSRMRTVRNSRRLLGGVCSRGEGVCSGWCLLGGGVSALRGDACSWGRCLLWGGLLWGVSAPGGVCSGDGVSALGGSAPGGVCSGDGVSALRGFACSWGLSALGAWYPSMHWGGAYPHPPPHPRGQTHRCKNITFATSLRTVIIMILSKWSCQPCLSSIILTPLQKRWCWKAD